MNFNLPTICNQFYNSRDYVYEPQTSIPTHRYLYYTLYERAYHVVRARAAV